MNLVRYICDENPRKLLRQEALISRLPVYHKCDGNAGHATLMEPHFRLFPSFFSIHVDTTTLFDRLKRKKDA